MQSVDLKGYSCFRGMQGLPKSVTKAGEPMFMASTITSAFSWQPADPAGVQGMQRGEHCEEHPSAAPWHCQTQLSLQLSWEGRKEGRKNPDPASRKAAGAPGSSGSASTSVCVLGYDGQQDGDVVWFPPCKGSTNPLIASNHQGLSSVTFPMESSFTTGLSVQNLV